MATRKGGSSGQPEKEYLHSIATVDLIEQIDLFSLHLSPSLNSILLELELE